MAFLRLALLVCPVAIALLIAGQNPTPVLPLVVLGRPIASFSLGVWVAGFATVGFAVSLVSLGLSTAVRLSGRSRWEPELRSVDRQPRRPTPRRQAIDALNQSDRDLDLDPDLDLDQDLDRDGSVRTGSQKRQSDRSDRATQSRADEVDRELEADWLGSGHREKPGPRRSRFFDRLAGEAAADRGPAGVNDPELDELLETWEAPDRRQKGWDDPEWDEAAWADEPGRSRPGSPGRSPGPRSRQPGRDRSTPARNLDTRDPNNPTDRNEPEDWTEDEPGRSPPPRPRSQPPESPPEPLPELKNFEAPSHPEKAERIGSIYSIAYRRDDTDRTDNTDRTDTTHRPIDSPDPTDREADDETDRAPIAPDLNKAKPIEPPPLDLPAPAPRPPVVDRRRPYTDAEYRVLIPPAPQPTPTPEPPPAPDRPVSLDDKEDGWQVDRRGRSKADLAIDDEVWDDDW